MGAMAAMMKSSAGFNVVEIARWGALLQVHIRTLVGGRYLKNFGSALDRHDARKNDRTISTHEMFRLFSDACRSRS